LVWALRFFLFGIGVPLRNLGDIGAESDDVGCSFFGWALTRFLRHYSSPEESRAMFMGCFGLFTPWFTLLVAYYGRDDHRNLRLGVWGCGSGLWTGFLVKWFD